MWRSPSGEWVAETRIAAGVGGVVLVDDNSLWVSMSDNRLLEFDLRPGAHSLRLRRTLRPGVDIPNAAPFDMIVDRRKRLWLVLTNGEVALFSQNKSRVIDLPRYQDLPGDVRLPSARFIAEDKSGNIWLGDYSFGLDVLAKPGDEKGKIFHFTAAHGLPSDRIRALFADQEGRMWVGTRSGVAFIGGESDDLLAVLRSGVRFKAITSIHGLRSGSVRGITQDDNGTIWLATAAGFEWVRIVGDSIIVGSRPELDGIPMLSCGRMHDGILWCASHEGIYTYDVRRPEPPTHMPDVFIDKFIVGGTEVDLSGQLEFPHTQNNCAVEFTGVSLRHSLRYAYRLGQARQLGGEWHPLGKERRVTFAQLSPGAYTFEVKAITDNGVESLKPASVIFSILAPFWQQGWFIALVVLVAVSAPAGIMWLRTRHLLAIARVRTSLATDLHDDIGSSLTRVTLFASAAQEELRKRHIADDNKKLSTLLSDVSNISRNLVGTMSDIVWSVDPEKDSSEELTIRMKTYAGRVLEAKGIEYNVEISAAVSSLKLPPEFRRNVFLIFKEGLANVVQHSQATGVQLMLDRQQDVFLMAIGDNGKGFDRETLGRINGLKNMEKRAEQLGGTLEIQSTPMSGTVVAFRARLP